MKQYIIQFKNREDYDKFPKHTEYTPDEYFGVDKGYRVVDGVIYKHATLDYYETSYTYSRLPFVTYNSNLKQW